MIYFGQQFLILALQGAFCWDPGGQLWRSWGVSAEAVLGLCSDYRAECCASSWDHARSKANGRGDGNIAARGKEVTLLKSSAGEVRAPCGWDGGVLFASTFTLPACDKQMNLCFLQARYMWTYFKIASEASRVAGSWQGLHCMQTAASTW